MPTSSFELLKLTFPKALLFSYLNTMRQELSGCTSCLDIGCGPESPARHLKFEHSVGVEGYPPALEAAKNLGTHNDFVLAYATELDRHFSPGQFDCCIGLDLIEHLKKEDGLKLIRDMEMIASRKILLFTPNGFLPQQSHEGDMQEHLSGWTADEMRQLGFRVIGMHGWRGLRGEQHKHRLKPEALSGLLSAASHAFVTKRRPEFAAALMCVKDVSQNRSEL